jgi:double-strand break repair protein MRE11
LSEGETRGKHVVILEITQKNMQIIPVPLKTVRPFLIRDIVLREVVPRLEPMNSKAINQFLCAQVEELLSVAADDWREKQWSLPEDTRKPMPLPLIRLRVDYSGNAQSSSEFGGMDGPGCYAIMNPQRFGQQFVNRIANPRDAVMFVRKRLTPNASGGGRKGRLPPEGADSAIPGSKNGGERLRVEDLVEQFLANQRLDLFPQNEFCDTVRIAVEKDDRDAISSFVKASIERTLGQVAAQVRSSGAMMLEKDDIKGEFGRARLLREDEWRRLHVGFDELLASRPVAVYHRSDDENDPNERTNQRTTMDTDGESSEHEMGKENKIATRGRGRGRGTRGGSSARGRTGAVATSSIDAHPSSKRQTLDLTIESDKDASDDNIPNAAPKSSRTTTRKGAVRASPPVQPATPSWPPRRK